MEQKKKIKKGQRKKFFEVSVPLTSFKVNLYEYAPEYLENKIIKLDLTKSLRGKSLELKSKVKLKNDKLTAEIISLNLISSYIKRVMRKGIDYVEDSFELLSKDHKIRIKTFMITRKRVSRKVRKAIRDNARKYLISKARTRKTEELFSEIISNKIQKELSLKTKKIYPLALCEIRMIEIIKNLEKKENLPKRKDEQ